MDSINTALGQFSKEKFESLINIRSQALSALRSGLIGQGYAEVTTSSLVNIAGSCENPYASFTLNYYGRQAHLSQSAQLQLEALVIRLKRAVFTVNNSFREENFDDPENSGRRLSEFTLLEPERPFFGLSSQEILTQIIKTEEKIIKFAIENVLKNCQSSLNNLGANSDYLKLVLDTAFQAISYDQAIWLLKQKNDQIKFGDDFGILEERQLLKIYNNQPIFITHYPAQIKFFNMKRTSDGQRVYSTDLLMPPLGETSGGAVREENGPYITEYLLNSKIAQYVKEQGGNVLKQFEEYLKLFEQEVPVPRGGFGIGFERFIGFLLNSNDILNTIAYKSMQPNF